MLKVIKTKSEFEGHWFEEYVVAEGEGLSPWEPGTELRWIGKPETRVDGIARVTGQAAFTHDIQLPRMVYGKILRSPHPHARIRRLETGRAETFPGVCAVLSYKNIPRIPFRTAENFLFDERVRFVGDEVACVLTEDEEACEDAMEEIEVEYEPLPFVIDPVEALEPGAPRVWPGGNLFNGAPDLYERGDIRKGFAESDVIVEQTFKTPSALHNSMETHGSVAFWEGDRLILWDSTQHIFGVRKEIASLLRLPLHKVQVIKKYMGGGFGSKNFLGKYTLLAALGARMIGRPVKITLDRHEENLAAGNRPASVQRLKIGAKRDGSLTFVDLKAISGAGAYAIMPAPVGGPVRQLYSCPNVKTEQYTAFTHTGPMSAFRAPGYVEGTFALESLMDELAAQLGMDPLELRLKNYTNRDPMTGRPYSTKGLKEAYERGAREIGWDERHSPKMAAGPKRRGLGMASQIWGGSGGPPAYAIVKLNPDGTAIVLTGTQDIGTGTKTVLAQIAAEELNLSIQKISIEIGDTQVCPYAPISAGSMTLASVGPAVRVAAHQAREQLLDVAAQVLEIPRQTLALKDGYLMSPALKDSVPVKDVLSELKNFMIIGQGARSPNPEDVSIHTFGAQFAEVEVDSNTGEVQVLKMVAVHDSGRVINPTTLSSQIEGGILQGLGFGLTEQRIVDAETGVVLNADLENYKFPTVLDTPEILSGMVDRPDLHANNLGVKGAGEPPIIPAAAAVANAVADAIGVRMTELPITRDRILKVLSQQKPGTHEAL
jgi:xanthine dehydrogenase YagR molybdenum-binding subunit